MSKVKCFSCQKMGHNSCYCPEKWSGQAPKAKATPPELSKETPLKRANMWLRAIGGESNEVKNLILQTMWKDEDFPDT